MRMMRSMTADSQIPKKFLERYPVLITHTMLRFDSKTRKTVVSAWTDVEQSTI